MLRSPDPAAIEAVTEKADRYFAEQCHRLGPITAGSMIVARGLRPADLEAAAQPSATRARKRERA